MVVPITVTAVCRSWIILEIVKRPYNYYCHVHHNSKHIVTSKDFVKRKGEQSQQPADSEDDNEESKNETK